MIAKILRRGTGLMAACTTVAILLGYHNHLIRPTQSYRINDFVEYWASSRLLLMGKNPYSLPELSSLQKSVGRNDDKPLIMWNPPWTLTFLIPFGFLDFPIADFLWLVFNCAIMLFCAKHIWTIYEGSISHCRLAWAVTFLFAPTVVALLTGQIGPLILLGVVGFLHFEMRKQYGLAGASLVLVAIKPHLIYLLWPALLMWAIERRRWDAIFGLCLGLFSVSMVVLVLDPAAFNEYRLLHLTAPHPTPFDQETPTLGSALKNLVTPESSLSQFLPSLLGMFWLPFYWKTYKSNWQWSHQMPVILLVSLTTTFFAWTCDQVVLLPALLQGTVWCLDNRFRASTFLPMTFYLVVNFGAPLLKFFTPHDFWYFWLALTWLLIYKMMYKQITPSNGIA